jgi:hypothetical protein
MTQGKETAAALLDLIRGDGVRRASHELNVDSRDVTGIFLELLASEGFMLTPVEEIPVRPGERVPAFWIEDHKAHFGWVFWELFTTDRRRKLFGSQVKNEKGDWAIMRARRQAVYACPGRKETMDVEHPSTI